MCAVHIGIGKDNDLIIPEPADVKIISDPAAKGGDHRLYLIVHQNLFQGCLLHIQNLPPQGQHSLCPAVACRLDGAAGRISLYDINLAFLWFFG